MNKDEKSNIQQSPNVTSVQRQVTFCGEKRDYRLVEARRGMARRGTVCSWRQLAYLASYPATQLHK